MSGDVPSEQDLLEYMEQLAEAERDGARQAIVIGPYTAMLMIGTLQMATRHPHFPERQHAQILSLIDQFRPWFAGTLGEHMIDLGNDPEADR